ncbi:MAG: aspartate-semialdehyde dehydrogenase [Clostridiaceae bacterium]|nr:aspartate-semialdehyde dehydrogenase [Clostridiaceae bacterium]
MNENQLNRKMRVGIVGATGYVGQRFATILSGHPWFKVTVLAASARSAGKTYREATADRWNIDRPMPPEMADMILFDAADIKALTEEVDFLFCAVDMPKTELIALEEALARTETPVVSNNSANRWGEDIPVIIPEINPHHCDIIPLQRKRLGTERGFIVTKPNCSIQTFMPPLAPLMEFGPERIFVCTYQAISGAGKTFKSWPEMEYNLIPFISGEEEKTEREPLKIWGYITDGKFVSATLPMITAQCYRVPVQEGHTAAVSVAFRKPVSIEEILVRWQEYRSLPQKLNLPTAPKQPIHYLTDNNRPQVLLDVDRENGMAISVGRLRPDPLLDYKFACLSHNTIRGAAGGAVLTAELLVKQGFIRNK